MHHMHNKGAAVNPKGVWSCSLIAALNSGGAHGWGARFAYSKGKLHSFDLDFI
jgi:hypothetical protein